MAFLLGAMAIFHFQTKYVIIYIYIIRSILLDIIYIYRVYLYIIFTCSIENMMNPLTTGTAMASSGVCEFVGWEKGVGDRKNTAKGPLRTSMDTIG